MSDEVIFTIIIGVIPIAILGVTVPQSRSKTPLVASGIAIAIILGLLLVYVMKLVSQTVVLYGAITASAISLVTALVFIATGKSTSKLYTKNAYTEEWKQYQLFRELIISLRISTDIASVFDEIQKHTFIFNSDYILEKFRLFRGAIEEMHKFNMNKAPIIDDMLEETNKWMHKRYKR